MVSLSILGLLLSAPTAPQAPGRDYPPVSAEEVPLLKFFQYFTPDDQYRARDFAWNFTRDRFTLKKEKAAIPADLQKKLLPEGMTADEITGKWSLGTGEKGGQVIIFTDIQAGGRSGRERVSYPIYKTAPTVVRIGRPQYVFSLERK